MPSKTVILGFDTSAAHCAAALLQGATLLASSHQDMKRGQAEALMPSIEALLHQAGKTYQDIGAIAVGIGPGNFTGIRISVSAARGMGLALGVPMIGVSSFELMRDPDTLSDHANELVAAPAPRGQVYVQGFTHGRPTTAPQQIDPAQPPQSLLDSGFTRVTGSEAPVLAQAMGIETALLPPPAEQIGERLVRCAAWRRAQGIVDDHRPAPLYVRPADAAPPRDPAPVILDDLPTAHQ